MSVDDVVSAFMEYAENIDIAKQAGNLSSLLYGTVFSNVVHPLFHEHFGFDFGKLAFIIEPDKGTLLFSESKFERCTKHCYERFRHKGLSELTEEQKYQTLSSSIDTLYSSGRTGDVESLLERIDLLRRFILYTFFCESASANLVEQMYDGLEDTNTTVDTVLDAVFLTTFKSITYRKNEVLLDFAENGDVERARWVLCDYFDVPTVEQSETELREEIDERGKRAIRAEQEELEAEIAENEERLGSLFDTMTYEEEQLTRFLRYAVRIRDVRKEYAQKIMTEITDVARRFLRSCGVRPELAPYINYTDLLGGAPELYESTLRKRSDGAVGLFSSADVALHPVEHVEQVKQQLLTTLHDGSDGIEGQTAYEGMAEGTVKVVGSKEEFDKFDDGDVLVTSMTRPEFVSLMKRASAVVTDEGGVTCHAAIVSRELEKPCVIGTGNATTVLQDGQHVTVDAENGTVQVESSLR